MIYMTYREKGGIIAGYHPMQLEINLTFTIYLCNASYRVSRKKKPTDKREKRIIEMIVGYHYLILEVAFTLLL